MILGETMTRRHNGETCTIIKFVILRELASRLKAYKGKEVEMYLGGDLITMLF